MCSVVVVHLPVKRAHGPQPRCEIGGVREFSDYIFSIVPQSHRDPPSIHHVASYGVAGELKTYPRLNVAGLHVDDGETRVTRKPHDSVRRAAVSVFRRCEWLLHPDHQNSGIGQKPLPRFQIPIKVRIHRSLIQIGFVVQSGQLVDNRPPLSPRDREPCWVNETLSRKDLGDGRHQPPVNEIEMLIRIVQDPVIFLRVSFHRASPVGSE